MESKNSKDPSKEKISVINPNGTLLSISKRSWDLLTPQRRNHFQVLTPSVKIEIPQDVKEYMRMETKNDIIPMEEVTVIEKEPEQVPEQMPDPVTLEVTQPPEIPQEPVVEKTKQEYNQVKIKVSNLKNAGDKLQEINRMKREMKGDGLDVPMKLTYVECKKLYDDYQEQKNRKV